MLVRGPAGVSTEIIDGNAAVRLDVVCVSAALAAPAHGELSAEGSRSSHKSRRELISVPFQNNSTSTSGRKGTQNVLNIQPVYPIHVNEEWNVITRTIVPVISMPALSPTDSAPTASATFSSRLFCRRPIRAAGSGRRRRHATANAQQRQLGNDAGGSVHVRRAAPRKGVRGSTACW